MTPLDIRAGSTVTSSLAATFVGGSTATPLTGSTRKTSTDRPTAVKVDASATSTTRVLLGTVTTACAVRTSTRSSGCRFSRSTVTATRPRSTWMVVAPATSVMLSRDPSRARIITRPPNSSRANSRSRASMRSVSRLGLLTGRGSVGVASARAMRTSPAGTEAGSISATTKRTTPDVFTSNVGCMADATRAPRNHPQSLSFTPPTCRARTKRRAPCHGDLQIDRLHERLGITEAGHRTRRDGVRDPRHLVRRQPHLERAEVFLEPVATLGAGDRHDVAAASEQPGERQLPRRAAVLAGKLLHLLDEIDVALEIFLLEPRMSAPAVVFRDVGNLVHLPGEQAAAQRRVGDQRDAELPQRRQRLLGLDPIEQRVLDLQRGEGMDAVRAAHRGRGRLGQTEIAHLPLLHEPRHGPDRLLDRDGRIDAVLVVEVDHVHAESLQARVARLRHVLRTAIDARGPIGLSEIAELGGEHDLVALPAQGGGEELLVVAPAVHVGGVDEVHAKVQRAVHDGDRLCVVTGTIGAGHRHTAESDGADLETALAETSPLHS